MTSTDQLFDCSEVASFEKHQTGQKIAPMGQNLKITGLVLSNTALDSIAQCSVKPSLQSDWFEMGLDQIVQSPFRQASWNGWSYKESDNPVPCHVRKSHRSSFVSSEADDAFNFLLLDHDEIIAN
jgi:hypothetical protein